MSNIDVSQARYNMIEQQIRPWEVLDTDALELFEAISREQFVPEQYRNIAFSDMELPIGEGKKMLLPSIEAHFLQALSVKEGEKVLVVGTGSGYLTALLAKRAAKVISVEIHASLSEKAAQRLSAAKIDNVELVIGDASSGWNSDSKFDVIAITGSLPELPPTFEHSLNIGGRLLAVIGEAANMQAQLVTRISETEWDRKGLFFTVLTALENSTSAKPFTL